MWYNSVGNAEAMERDVMAVRRGVRRILLSVLVSVLVAEEEEGNIC